MTTHDICEKQAGNASNGKGKEKRKFSCRQKERKENGPTPLVCALGSDEQHHMWNLMARIMGESCFLTISLIGRLSSTNEVVMKQPRTIKEPTLLFYFLKVDVRIQNNYC